MDARLVPRRRVVPSFHVHVHAGVGSADIPRGPGVRRGVQWRCLLGVSLALIATTWEAQTSELQSRFFGHWSSALSCHGIHPHPFEKDNVPC
jgi:hypothetical protein